ncbi:hypothetical protein AVEN_11719-1 [Araneus ventricosus]|uniref:Uncharacterized protein n=1 Tax=Araneus ventricosus TaxID=182803 RepID=A0A4Y2IFK7_ARAVE|nr:hypothetical protein AVEN_11719-1 [Araneus ventricosus]
MDEIWYIALSPDSKKWIKFRSKSVNGLTICRSVYSCARKRNNRNMERLRPGTHMLDTQTAGEAISGLKYVDGSCVLHTYIRFSFDFSSTSEVMMIKSVGNDLSDTYA